MKKLLSLLVGFCLLIQPLALFSSGEQDITSTNRLALYKRYLQGIPTSQDKSILFNDGKCAASALLGLTTMGIVWNKFNIKALRGFYNTEIENISQKEGQFILRFEFGADIAYEWTKGGILITKNNIINLLETASKRKSGVTTIDMVRTVYEPISAGFLHMTFKSRSLPFAKINVDSRSKQITNISMESFHNFDEESVKYLNSIKGKTIEEAFNL